MIEFLLISIIKRKMVDKSARERSIERMNNRISASKKNSSRRGEPIASPRNLNVGQLSRGRDGKLWVVVEKKTNNDQQILVKKWVHF